MSQRRNKFAFITIVSATMLFLANLAVDNHYTQSFVNYYLNEKLLSKIPITFEYQSMKIQLLPPAIHLFGITIRDKEPNSEDQELVSTSQISLVISPWSLFLAKPQIGDLEIHDLTAFWPPPEKILSAIKSLEPVDSNSKGTEALWPPRPAPPFSSMKIQNAKLQLKFSGVSLNTDQDPLEETTISTVGADLNIDFNGWRDIRIKTEIQKLSIWDRGRSYLENANLVVNGSLRNDTFQTSKLTLTSPRISTEGGLTASIMTSNQGRVIDSFAIETTQNTTADFSVFGSLVDLSGTMGAISGTTKTRVNIPVKEGAKPKLLVEGSARSHGAILSGFHLFDSEADFAIDLKGITFKEARIKSNGKSFGTASGKLAFNSELTYSFFAKPENLPFDMLLSTFNVPFDVINFGLTSQNLEITGTGDPFKMKVVADGALSDFDTPSISYDHSKIPTSPRCDIHFDLRINNRQIDYDGTGGRCRSAAENSASFPLVFLGTTTFSEKTGIDLSIKSIAEFNPGPISYFAQASLGGLGRFATRIHGPYSRVVVDSDFLIEDFSIQDIEFGSIKASSSIADKRFQWTNLRVNTPRGGEISSENGVVSFMDELSLDAGIKAVSLDSDLLKSIMAAISGDHKSTLELKIDSLDAKLQGPLLKPFLYRGNIDLVASGIKDLENEYASKFTAKISGTENGFEAKQAKLLLGNFEATIDGSLIRAKNTGNDLFYGGLGLSRADQVSLSVLSHQSAQKSDQLLHVPIISKFAQEYGLRGTLSGQGKLTGTLEKLSGLAKIDVANAQILSIPAPTIKSSIIVNGLKLDIIAEQGGNSLKGRLNVDLGDKELPYSWYLTCNNFDARPLFPPLFSADPRSFAYFTGTWSMAGQLSHWWESSGELTVKSIRSRFYPPKENGNAPFEVQSQKPFHVDMTKTGWSSRLNEKLSLVSPFGLLELSLQKSQPPATINLPMRGLLKLESLKSIFPTIEVATGQIKIEGGIFGSIANPLVDLLVSDAKISSDTSSTWQPISLGLADYRPPVKDLTVRARVQLGGIQVEQLSAQKGAGTIEASGFYAFANSGEANTDLRIKIQDAAFMYPFPIVKNFDSVIDGAIQITGQKSPLTASGRVNIKKARSNRDIDIREAILSSIRSSGTKAGPQTLEPTVIFDIAVTADDSISFNSRAVQATLSSNLQISGSDVSPEILGLIEINKGKFFDKRDFFIKRGLINYDDPIRADPSLDISSVCEVAGYKVTIAIAGRASDPSIDFSVDPATRPDGTALSKVDIITLLNRGSLPENTAGSNTNAESTAASEALNLLAGQVEDTVQKVFDLSGQNIIKQVYIDTYAAPTGPIARFNLPLNITDDLDLILKVDQNTLKLSSEYSLHDSISLTGGIESSSDEASNGTKRQGTPADTGVDIKFRFAFP